MFSIVVPGRAALAACLLVTLLTAAPSLAQDGGDIAARLSRLEAEMAELKAMVGGLASQLHARPGIAPGDGSGMAQTDLGPRVSALETQIGALTSELQRLGQRMGATGAPPDAAPLTITPPPGGEPGTQAPPPQAEAEEEEEGGILDIFKDDPDEAEAPASGPGPSAGGPAVGETDARARWYGPRPGDDPNAPQSITPPSLSTGTLPDNMPQSLAALPNQDAQTLYQQGYGAFLQRDYGEAETAFTKLVAEHPDDPLAGNAQYWAGESQYVRKQYKKAADTFLTGYRKYSGSEKAPDTLLRLGMSLAALGHKDAACSTFKELDDRFPGAPAHIRDQAKGEAGKAGC